MLLRRFAVACLFVVGVVAAVASDGVDPDSCETDADNRRCADSCGEFVVGLQQALPPPVPTTGLCVRFNDSVGCGCFVDDGERDLAALSGVDLRLPDDAFASDAFCAVRDRLGDCLLEPADFPGCTVDGADDVDRDICADVCATVDERRQAAAAALPDVEIERAQCDTACSCRVRDGERCVVVEGFEFEAEFGEDFYLRFSPCDEAL